MEEQRAWDALACVSGAVAVSDELFSGEVQREVPQSGQYLQKYKNEDLHIKIENFLY